MKKCVSFFLGACCMCLPGILMAQRIKGSDTVLPLTQELSEMYMNQNPSATVTVTGGGSGVGISALLDGTTDLAMASRKIKFSEKMKMKQSKHEPCEYIVAYDALAVIVNPQNPVKQLTREQLEGIFRGKITNWKEVGGEDARIVVYSRETSSGTYEFFKESVVLLLRQAKRKECHAIPQFHHLERRASQNIGFGLHSSLTTTRNRYI